VVEIAARDDADDVACPDVPHAAATATSATDATSAATRCTEPATLATTGPRTKARPPASRGTRARVPSRAG
jgi:hypothetical protein